MAKSTFFNHAMSIRLHQSRDTVCFVALCRTGTSLLAAAGEIGYNGIQIQRIYDRCIYISIYIYICLSIYLYIYIIYIYIDRDLERISQFTVVKLIPFFLYQSEKKGEAGDLIGIISRIQRYLWGINMAGIYLLWLPGSRKWTGHLEWLLDVDINQHAPTCHMVFFEMEVPQ